MHVELTRYMIKVLERLTDAVNRVERSLDIITMEFKMSQEELLERLNKLVATQKKVEAEIVSMSAAQNKMISDLQAALAAANQPMTPEVIAALDEAQAIADRLDAIVPDPVVSEEPVVTEEQPAQ